MSMRFLLRRLLLRWLMLKWRSVLLTLLWLSRAVVAQAVAHGIAVEGSHEGVSPPVSPLVLQRATSFRVAAAEEAVDEAVMQLASVTN